ncbi:MAG TPA: hypothetical protein VFV34_01565 [Blastocatellia bacterium]|nr:hypothetical protein [Blastocatellia bacterium]
MRDHSERALRIRVRAGAIVTVVVAAALTGPDPSYVATAQEPDPRSLVAEAAQGGAMQRLLSEYTCRMKVTFKESDRRKPTERTRTYEMYVHQASRRYQRTHALVEEKGKQVTTGDVEMETGDLNRLEREANKATAGELTATAPPKYAVWTYKDRAPFGRSRAIAVSILDVLDRCEFHSPRRDRLNDRDVIAISFRPASSVLPDAVSYLAKLQGVIWIDTADKVVVRLEASTLDTPETGSSRSPQHSPAIVYDQLRTKEGVWVPRTIRINGADYPDLFGVRRDIVADFSDYSKFTVDVKEGPTAAPKNRIWNR